MFVTSNHMIKERILPSYNSKGSCSLPTQSSSHEATYLPSLLFPFPIQKDLIFILLFREESTLSVNHAVPLAMILCRSFLVE